MSPYGEIKALDLSKREAERNRILMEKREFWFVEPEDNGSLLQGILNALYNEHGCYVVKYENFNSTTKIIIWCNLCHAALSSNDPFNSHNSGRAHIKAVQVNQHRPDASISGPLIYKRTNCPKGMFDRNTLEDRLDHTKQRVVGMQFIYKFKETTTSTDFVFSCQLCDKKALSEDDIFHHITEDAHALKYMNVKFGINAYKSSRTFFESELHRIEESEGRINHRILDFSKNLSKSVPDEHSARASSVAPSHLDRITATPPLTPPPIESGVGTNVEGEDIDQEMGDYYPFAQNLIESFVGKYKSDTVNELLYANQDYQEVIINAIQVLSNKIAKYHHSVVILNENPAEERKRRMDACKLTRKSVELKPLTEEDN